MTRDRATSFRRLQRNLESDWSEGAENANIRRRFIHKESDALSKVSPAKVLERINPLLAVLSGDKLANTWVPYSTLERALQLRRAALSQASWAWREPSEYLRLLRKGKVLTSSRRKQHNRRVYSRLASDPVLASLNSEQRHAVINLNDRVFVSAGAGSGKTRTIVEKVRHVVHQGVARPEQVVVITLTKKATDEVRDRLSNVGGVVIETLHRLAMLVIKQHTGNWPKISPLASKDSLRLQAFSNWLDEALSERPDLFLELYVRNEAFRRNQASDKLIRVPPGDTVVRSFGEARIALALHISGVRYSYEKELIVPEHLNTRPDKHYTPDFFIPDDPDLPDSPPDAGIWLEHYSHDRNGKLPPEYLNGEKGSSDKYNAERAWKRKVFAATRLRYVETCYGDIERTRSGDISFVELLLSRINAHRKSPVAIPDPALVEQRLRTIIARDNAGTYRVTKEINAWIRTWRQRSRIERNRKQFEVTRNVQFAASALAVLARPVMAHWEQHLEETDTNDFEGVILRASDLITESGTATPWKFVLLDEAQDVNPAQIDFVEALTGPLVQDKTKRQAQLTAVGDAWQAIFGFQGGDPSYIDNEGTKRDRQRKYTERIDLARTYRHADPIALTAKAYVLRYASGRPRQLIADPEGFRDECWPGAVSMGSCRPTAKGFALPGITKGLAEVEESTNGILCVLRRIEESRSRVGDTANSSVLILCRHNAGLVDCSQRLETRARDILCGWDEKPASLPDYLWGKSTNEFRKKAEDQARKQGGFHHVRVQEAAANAGVDVSFSTIHAAKGREADYVIVLDTGPGKAAEQASVKALDEALILLRGREVHDKEEHRIGYVALTRARRKTYLLLTPAGEEGSLWAHNLWRNEHREFDVSEEELAELLEPIRPQEPCPTCNLRGDEDEFLVMKKGRYGVFVSCTSFRGQDARERSCEHKERTCESCGKGIMIRDGQGLSMCHDQRCGWMVPLCGCKVAKPMNVRTNREDGGQFLGCQDFGSPTSCRKTEILDWRERPDARRWWNPRNAWRSTHRRVHSWR